MNNKGFGSREILTVSVVCFLLATILLTMAIQTSTRQKYKVLQDNARLFGVSATTYQMENSNNVIYMVELLDNELFSYIKNPFGGEKYCNPFESKVEYADDSKYVTLRCGKYLISRQPVMDDEYSIYKVSDWSFEKMSGDNVEEVSAYNYKVDGKDGFDAIYNEEMFLYAFNKKMGQNYETVDSIPSRYQVYTKTLYRTKTLVDVVEKKK